jgi:hypothetical protein
MLGISYNIPNITERNKMITDKTFKITYYADKHKKHITRLGKWIDGCRIWQDKKGKTIFTYWDMDAENFRNASVSWTVRY